MKEKIYLWDLDGTLCNLDHRLKYIKTEGKRKDWRMFFLSMVDDTLIQPTAAVLWALRQKGFKLVFCSGRPEEYRSLTTNWLRDKLFLPLDEIELHMRKKGDFRDDTLVKGELLDVIQEKYEVIAAFDDRKRIVDYYRSRGLFVFDVRQTSEEY